MMDNPHAVMSQKYLKELLAQRKKDEKENTRRKVPTLSKEGNNIREKRRK